MVNIKDFHSNLLERNKKSHKDIDIYYIGYITIKKFSDCENIHSVNPLCLIIYSATGYFKEKNGEKYLILDSIEKYEEVFSGIISKIKTLNKEKELFYEKNYAKIGVNTDDDIPLNKPLKFPMLLLFIRCVLEKGEKLYRQIYLDECLYEIVKMLEYDRIDISEEIDINKTNKSKECKICHYWYFKDFGFKYEPHLCNGCHGLLQKAVSFNNITIVYVKGSAFRIHFWYMSKDDAINIMNNSSLIDKMGVL